MTAAAWRLPVVVLLVDNRLAGDGEDFADSIGAVGSSSAIMVMRASLRREVKYLFVIYSNIVIW